MKNVMGRTCKTHNMLKNEYEILVRIPEGRNHMGDLCIDGWTISKLI
jgi:hypothetical protein